ncbi:hypothetical protein P256_01741 [Acinetobacter nectaris CIP 110549]|uniref:HPP transmembrane region domain-containing protein n=1 Tax=Acinetobacter nectaris CIP 110549 TaxID=1392540 RepID=V2TQF9_9GAMM|nr:HPP family protein [Acinetobacter nectaris]ESK38210.1 hypothetical protein P256_01741 [Acinetobacter nectaris CIP 110549]
MKSIFHGKEKVPARASNKEIFYGFMGGMISIFSLLFITQLSGHLLIMAPFGASCVLLYAAPQSPLAQPRNIIFGHFISAAIGLIFLNILGTLAFSIACAVGLAIACMQFFQCVHPPAGANPLVILLTAHEVTYHWSFLFFPVLLGSVTLVAIAYAVHQISQTKWPIYQLGLLKTPPKK